MEMEDLPHPIEDEQISFLDATERVCQDCRWLVPVYYLRTMLAVIEMAREEIRPCNYRISVCLVDDNYMENICDDEDLLELLPQLKQIMEVSEIMNLLLFSGKSEGMDLRLDKPAEYDLLRAVSDLYEVGESSIVHEFSGFKRMEPPLAPWQQCIPPVSFVKGSSAYLDDVSFIKKKQEVLQERLANADETEKDAIQSCSAALDKYLALLKQFRSPLIIFKSSMSTFIGLCQRKRFPLPDEYHNHPSKFSVNKGYDLLDTSDYWELPKAIWKVFGDIGCDLFSEHIVLYAVMGEDDMPCNDPESLQDRWEEIANTLEYRKAKVAVDGGSISAFFDAEKDVYLVVPESFLSWVVKVGVSVPQELRHLVKETLGSTNNNMDKKSSVSKRTTTVDVESSAQFEPQYDLETTNVSEDPKLATKIHFWREGQEVKGRRTLCLRTSHPKNGKSGSVQFQPGESKNKLLEMLLAAEENKKASRGVSFGELLQGIYGINLDEKMKQYISVNSTSGTKNNLSDRDLFSRVLQPDMKRIQSLISATRDKLEKHGIDPRILPVIHIGYRDKSSRVRLNVAGVVDTERTENEKQRGISLDRLVNYKKRHSPDENDDEITYDQLMGDDDDSLGKPNQLSVNPDINEDMEL